MQKLVTIMISASTGRSRDISEHLEELLKDGWKINSLTEIRGLDQNSNSSGYEEYLRAWIAVVLEK